MKRAQQAGRKSDSFQNGHRVTFGFPRPDFQNGHRVRFAVPVSPTTPARTKGQGARRPQRLPSAHPGRARPVPGLPVPADGRRRTVLKSKWSVASVQWQVPAFTNHYPLKTKNFPTEAA